MKNVAVVSHIADMDGVGAAALLKMKFKIPKENLLFTGYELKEVKETIAALRSILKKNRNLVLFITDLSPNAETLPLYEGIIKDIRKQKGLVVWLDHHFWNDAMLKRVAAKCDLAVVGENKDMCATQLVQKLFGLNGSFAKEFTHLVHLGDFFLKTSNKKHAKLINSYAFCIDYFRMGGSLNGTLKNLRDVAGTIASGSFMSKKMEEAASRFRHLNEKRINEMLGDIYRLSKKFAVGFSKHVDSTLACMSIIYKTHSEVAVLINMDRGSGSIRSTRPNIVPLANKLNGGGHPHAAGFSVPKEKYNFFRRKSDRDKLSENIRQAAAELDLL